MRRPQGPLTSAMKRITLTPEERALITPVLDDYFEQERMADLLGISRSELVTIVERILSEHGE
jgi:predicted DNA-binding protein (UPF0251 family)